MADDPDIGLSNRSILLAASLTAFGLGCAEIALLAVAHFALGRYTHVNPQNIWMTPLWYLGVGLLLCAAVLLLWRRHGPTRTVAALFVPTWMGTLGVGMLLTRVHVLATIVLAAGIALQYARAVAARPRLVARAARAMALTPLLLAVLTFAGLNGSRVLREWQHDAAQEGRRPNVLLVILDTVRAASLGLYGAERETTPVLTAFAQQGTVFDMAFATSSWTLPSHASMFTGLLPSALPTDWMTPLHDEPVTLAEVLTRHGYRTGGFAANTFYGSRESGLARGFVSYQAYPIWSPGHFVTASSIGRALVNNRRFRRAIRLQNIPGRRDAEDIIDSFLRWQGRDVGQPFFAFLNLYDAHAPYLPPAPWDTLFGPLLPGRDPSMQEGRQFTTRELQAEIDAYDGAIAFMDDRIGSMLEALRSRGVLDQTLVIVTSDHGEEFGEHGVFTHGNSLYTNVLRVPLLMVLPGTIPAGRRIGEWVSLRNLPATIVDIAGTGEPFPGSSLREFWDTTSPSLAARGDTLYASVTKARGRPAGYPVSRGDLHTAMSQPYRLILHSDGGRELYRVDIDPAEADNLSGQPGAGGADTALLSWLSRLLNDR
jgi:arylsulfatase A-like enzyme